MANTERWTIWLMPDSDWPCCVERGASERAVPPLRRVEVVPASQLRGAVEAFEAIRIAAREREDAEGWISAAWVAQAAELALRKLSGGR